jgi:HK97 family phage prohead protease
MTATSDFLAGPQARFFDLSAGAIRAVDGDDGWDLEGIAAPYGKVMPISNEFTEEFVKGCFKRSYQNKHGKKSRLGPDGEEVNQGVPLQLMHDHTVDGSVGRSVAFVETDYGLVGRWKFHATKKGREAREMVLDGVVTGLSVGFQPYPPPDGNIVEPRGAGQPVHVRRNKAHLHEVSLVPVPAYPDAVVSVVRAGTIEAPRPFVTQLRRFLETEGQGKLAADVAEFYENYSKKSTS